ncbi:capsid triplex subunit 2 [macacine betaherpesvirus 9]|uniref:Capsid triplex subunit 2 n=1 Tax=macacine betaherpesvirus 9 TaxID=2560568 RepID=A0A192XP53_9BETA|nr:capsid triplex subunit 2 [macacine betaherpesvirus 9]ANC96571.1 capsid triplex subunit 2 [macacine betaherpesvirus 9]
MDSVYCTFDQKLSLSDIGTLCKLANTVIPIYSHHHLIGNSNLGLYNVLSTTNDYVHLRDTLRTMVLTILQKVEGNQLVLIRPKIGQQYEIRNTGPFPLEKGDRLSLIPPLQNFSQKLLAFSDWELVLPLLIPTDIATEINIRMLCIGLISIHRKYEEIQTIIDELCYLQYRDVTIKLPDIINDGRSMFSMKTACISFSMIATMAPDLVQTYIERLSLEDHSMLLIKCQELLAKRTTNNQNIILNATEIKTELKKIKTVLTMINQINSLTQEKTFFIVSDVSADNRLATCIFKE